MAAAYASVLVGGAYSTDVDWLATWAVGCVPGYLTGTTLPTGGPDYDGLGVWWNSAGVSYWTGSYGLPATGAEDPTSTDPVGSNVRDE